MNYYDVGINIDPMDGDQKWTMPMTDCPECGQGDKPMGFQFPEVDLELFKKELDLKRFVPGKLICVPWAEFLEIRATLKRLLQTDFDFPPTTRFGPLVGKGMTKMTSFAGPDFVTIVTTNSTLEKLVVAGITDLRTASTLIKPHKSWSEPVLQLVIPAVAKTSKACGPKHCSACGNTQFINKGLIFDRSSLVDNPGLVRGLDRPFNILASEHFKRVYEQLGLTGLKFDLIELREQ